MRRAKLNLPLVLGIVMALGFLYLFAVGQFAPPPLRCGTTVLEMDGELRRAPFAPGVAGYRLGSDRNGCDVYSLLVRTARSTLVVALGGGLGRALLGVPLGLVAGWYRGRIGRMVSSVSASFSALPSLVLVLFLLWGLAQVIPHHLRLAVVMAAIALAGAPRVAEQVRQLTEEVALQPYIEAAVATGARPGRILLRHVLPVMSGDLLMLLAAEMGWALLLMGQLAIFGVGIGAGSTWADRLVLDRDLIRTQHYWVPMVPGVALGLVIACFQLLAEGFRLRLLRR